VVVVGAGIARLTTARMLADTGRKIAVIEADELCAGVTGYTTAKVTALHAAIYTRLVDTWEPAEPRSMRPPTKPRSARSANSCRPPASPAISRTRRRTPTPRRPTVSTSSNAKPRRRAKRASTRRSPPTPTCPYAVRAAVRVDDQAQFHPRSYRLGLADAIVRAGGSVFEHTRAVDDDDDGSGNWPRCRDPEGCESGENVDTG